MNAFAREDARIMREITTDDGEVITLADWQRELRDRTAALHARELREQREEAARYEAQLRMLRRPWAVRVAVGLMDVVKAFVRGTR